MSMKYIVIQQHARCSDAGHRIEYSSDLIHHDSRREAISHGFKLVDSDDFNIGVVCDGRLVSFDWMDKRIGEGAVLDKIAENIGLNDKDLSKPISWRYRATGANGAVSTPWYYTRNLPEYTLGNEYWDTDDVYSGEYVRSMLEHIAELEREKSLADIPLLSIRDVVKERLRQVEKEGWTPEHDDQHSNGELSFAAISYLMSVVNPNASHGWWPWDVKSWNPSSDFRHNLVRAGALILAEIDRLDRVNDLTV